METEARSEDRRIARIQNGTNNLTKTRRLKERKKLYTNVMSTF
jgi:hypothetical protein